MPINVRNYVDVIITEAECRRYLMQYVSSQTVLDGNPVFHIQDIVERHSFKSPKVPHTGKEYIVTYHALLIQKRVEHELGKTTRYHLGEVN